MLAAAPVVLVFAAALVQRTSAEGRQGEWRVFLTGDTKGYIHPCGCAQGLKGGLPRRATYLARVRQDGDLLVDLGNIIEGTRPQDRIRLRYVLEGLKLLRYDAVVPGPGELAYGEDFEAMAEDAGVRLVCANLELENGKRPFPAWHVHTGPDGWRVAVVGLTSPYQKAPDRYRVTDPADALRAARAELATRGVTDVIAAGYLKGKPALDLAKAFPDVALVAGGFVPRGTKTPLRRGGAPVVLAGERGQYVVSAELARMTVIRGDQAWLGEDVPDDEGLAALVARHDDEVSSLGSSYKAARLLAFRKKGWVGSESCRECHQTEYETWAKSKHAHAMETLRGKKQDRNPNCLECHYHDTPSGGEARSHPVGGIGCESCHGGAAAHVRSHRESENRQPARLEATKACVVCHDASNSPKFRRAEYWKRIIHGG